MSPSREQAAREAWTRWGVPYQPSCLDLSQIFPAYSRIVMEIGFGMGEATLEIARNRRDTGFLAVEVHHAGVARLLQAVREEGLDNIRVMEHDAAEVLRDCIPDRGLDGIHIFFPDPWPKKRHRKRRLIQAGFVSRLCKKLTAGGYIYTATDWEDYALQMAQVFREEPLLYNPYQQEPDPDSPGWAGGIEWRPRTRFEKKGREKNYVIRELFVRRAESPRAESPAEALSRA